MGPGKSFRLFTPLVALSLTCSAAALTYEDLRALIETEKLATVESLLARLPSDYLENYVLMSHSLSLQSGNPIAPRAILFGDDAELMLSFNGHPTQKNFRTLETLQYRRATGTFEFHRLTFSRDGREVQFSQTNPPLCLTCHTKRPRPNWNAAPLWPGAYGETGDFPTGKEREALTLFLRDSLPFGRYGFLLRREGSFLSPYSEAPLGRLRFRPNLRFSLLLMGHQASSLHAALKAHPKYPRFRYLFLFSRLNCATELDLVRELGRVFGEGGKIPFVSETGPKLSTLYAYVIRNAGVSPKEWSLAFPFPSEKLGASAYRYVSKLPDREMDLSDLVAARIVAELVSESPGLGIYLRPQHSLETLYGDDERDLPLARAIDDAMGAVDLARVSEACPRLLLDYTASGETSRESRTRSRPAPSLSSLGLLKRQSRALPSR